MSWSTAKLCGLGSGNYLMMRGYVCGRREVFFDLLLGLFLCIYPGVTLAILPVMLGFWMLYNSFVLLGFSGDFDTFGVPGGGIHRRRNSADPAATRLSWSIRLAQELPQS